ncbi:MAG: translation initiation factor [Chthoniobacteraceae bacterium]
MSKPNRKKIDVNSSPEGLAQPFAGLEIGGLPEAPETPPTPMKPTKKGRVLLRKETAHRGGKAVVVVYDLPTHFHPVEIENLAKRLRKACGCGGTVRGREIEIQGDQPAKIRAELEAEGFQVGGIR